MVLSLRKLSRDFQIWKLYQLWDNQKEAGKVFGFRDYFTRRVVLFRLYESEKEEERIGKWVLVLRKAI